MFGGVGAGKEARQWDFQPLLPTQKISKIVYNPKEKPTPPCISVYYNPALDAATLKEMIATGGLLAAGAQIIGNMGEGGNNAAGHPELHEWLQQPSTALYAANNPHSHFILPKETHKQLEIINSMLSRLLVPEFGMGTGFGLCSSYLRQAMENQSF